MGIAITSTNHNNLTGWKLYRKVFYSRDQNGVDCMARNHKVINNLLIFLTDKFVNFPCLSQPCKLFMTEEDVKFMFTEMIQRSEQLYLQ